MEINQAVTNRIEQEKKKRRIPWVAISEVAGLSPEQLKRRRDGLVSWTASEVMEISKFLQAPLESFFTEEAEAEAIPA